MSVASRFFAAIYDPMLRSSEEAGLAARRRELLASLSGRVLEIGAGTGVNIQHYPASVTQLTLTEPEEAMAKRLRRKLAVSGIDATVGTVPAEQLPFEDSSFDHVVSTLVLCTVPSLEATLAEIRRVLAPTGSLVVIEHVRSTDPKLAKWQDRWHPIWKAVGGGCNCNRDTVAALNAAGFDTSQLETGRFPKAAGIVRPLVAGAVSPGA